MSSLAKREGRAAAAQRGRRAVGGPGRPRSAKAQKAILDATLELLAETGMSGLTVEGVAARAHVGKATIYRRWSSKLPLVVDAIATLPQLPIPATGTLRSDLRQILGDLARILRSSLGRVLPHLASERASDPAAHEVFSRYVVARRRPLVAVVRHGIKRGELPANVDPEAVTDLFVGPIVNRLVFSHDAADASFIDFVIATVLEGTRRMAQSRSSHAGPRR
jgi:AcrR family transcriptional regulator